MRFAATARKEVGLRSIFNMLGPLTNPAGANCQIIGVYAPELTEMFAHTLRLLGSRQAYVVHGHDGLDEISVCAPTRVSELKEGQVRTFNLNPEAYFDAPADPGDLVGGDPATNAAITRRILDGETGPRRNVVLLNAAAALTAAGKATDFADGIQQAAQAIDSGAASDKLAALAAFTQEHAP
jgi:anthranilate phosphoribosyltransferase